MSASSIGLGLTICITRTCRYTGLQATVASPDVSIDKLQLSSEIYISVSLPWLQLFSVKYMLHVR